eukprot:c2688_g1_i1 orf=456-1856(-)
MATHGRPRIVFMAFGTQGDVYPLAAVAAGLAKAKPQYLVFLITHSAHESLKKVLSASDVAFVPITSPPVLSASSLDQYVSATVMDKSGPQFDSTTETVTKGGVSHLGNGWNSRTEEQHRQECLMAVHKILGSEQVNGDYIIINFFALEGWHLAELYQVPCAVAAPYVMPYSAPVSFERRFIKTHPLLYEKLKRGMPGTVGWEDVMHWMWPLFTERWTEWRVKQLHLSPCPLTDPVTELPLMHTWPTEPLLLYGFSKEVVECPSYWPSSVQVCGFWFLKPNRVCESESQHSASPELVAFLKESSIPPIFLGLSSIGSMGLMQNPEGMLHVLGGALKASDRKAILFTAAYAPLDAAILAAAGATEVIGSRVADSKLDNLKVLRKGVHLFANRLFCFSGSVPYLWLFPKCSLIIHHGGSGSTAAALQSGIPQEASNPRLQACAAAFGDRIRMEDGVAFAVDILCKNMLI